MTGLIKRQPTTRL